MLDRVRVVAGPARSGKTARLLVGYRQCLPVGPLGSALWLSPTSRAAQAVSRLLVGATLPGCLSPNLLTFHQLTARVLAAAAPRMRPLGPVLVRTILARIVADNLRAGRLRYFAPIAGTPGFLDLFVGWIRELKQVEIWPEELAAALGSRPGEKDRELCDLYRQYQDFLAAHDLYDAQGRFWAARQLLREGHWGPLAAVRHVFVDGFADFTRTEHDVLELLAARADTLTISLPLEPDTARQDLFLKSSTTLAELRRRHGELAVEHLPRASTAWPAMDHLERRLFAPPRDAQAADDSTGFEILAAAGTTQELELVAGRVKSLLVGGPDCAPVAAEDILVVFRELAGAAPLVREVFTQFGIPHAIAWAPRLEEAPVAAALVAWLRLGEEDWPFRHLLAMLAHNYFQPDWPEWQRGRAAVALARLVRHFELPSGRTQLVERVERLSDRASDDAGSKKRLGQPQLDAQLAAPLLRRLAAAFDALPARGTPGQWAAAIKTFAREIGLLAATSGSPLDHLHAEQDRSAWERIMAALAEIERLARWTGEAPPQWTLADAVAELEDLLRSEELPREHDETGCVRVLSAESARNLAAPYVFIAGLAEKSFPRPMRDDCIYSDAERRQLAAANLPLASHAIDSRFEMLLFYEVVTRATRQLVFSYPALDPAAQPLSASPYLDEVERACGAGRIRHSGAPCLSSVPATNDVRRPRDFRVRAVAQALTGEPALLADYCASPLTRASAPSLLAALAMSDDRRSRAYGRFDGMLESEAARAKLAERFGPARTWSPSQLEDYAYCPFLFFLKRVVRVEPPREPELGVDYMERGRLLHQLLAAAHRRLNERHGGPSSPGVLRSEPFARFVEELAHELLRHGSDRGLYAGLREIDLKQILAWLEEYFAQHAQYDELWQSWTVPLRPAHFEVSFGPRHRDEEAHDEPQVLDERADAISRLDPFELDCGGEVIRFAGRIDRIDVGEVSGQAVFNILDYKSGAGSARTSSRWIREGLALQLPLYTLAAESLLAERGCAAFRAAYWHVAGSGYRERDAVKFRAIVDGELEIDPDWVALEPQLRRRIRALVAGIRRGEFPMHSADAKCTSNCDFHTVCRVNQARSLDKSWQPPGGEA